MCEKNFFSSCNSGVGDDEGFAFMHIQHSENVDPVSGPRISKLLA